jgi:hypothetical protein
VASYRASYGDWPGYGRNVRVGYALQRGARENGGKQRGNALVSGLGHAPGIEQLARLLKWCMQMGARLAKRRAPIGFYLDQLW